MSVSLRTGTGALSGLATETVGASAPTCGMAPTTYRSMPTRTSALLPVGAILTNDAGGGGPSAPGTGGPVTLRWNRWSVPSQRIETSPSALAYR